MVQIAGDVNAVRTVAAYNAGAMRDDMVAQQTIDYPTARKADVVDQYHGVAVADPYRWLEDAEATETQTWVAAQNQLTRRLLDSPERDRLRSRLETLYRFPRGSAPVLRGGRAFFSFNDGSKNQPVLYVLDAAGPDGEQAGPRVLLDPNALSRDGTVALTASSPSRDGRLLAYALSHNGSDRQVIGVLDVGTATGLPDRLEWAKFTELSWTIDGLGFFYTRFPEPGLVAPGDEHYFAQVRYHRLGTAQVADELVFDRPGDREAVMSTDVSADGRWLVITVFRGASDLSEVYVLDLQAPGAQPVPVFTGFRAAYAFIEEAGHQLYFRTTEAAPRGRIVAVQVEPCAEGAPQGVSHVREAVAEASDLLASAHLVHGEIVAMYLERASHRIRRFGLDGDPRGDIALPSPGSVSGFSGEVDDDELFVRFSSFTTPPGVLRFSFVTGELDEWKPFEAPHGGDGASESTMSPAVTTYADYETAQVWYSSRDGTRVSMFLVHRRDLARDGRRPVLLTAYGGFNVSLTPQYDPANLVWLERGGVLAVPNLRGGGEYGEAWHRAGMLERKQNVFDDFIAAAEWLVSSGYTTPDWLAIEGGSNGGLLVGAVMVQRPELAGAVICRVPVVDMLRYHRFTVGRFWIAEYGSADDPSQFPYLHAYSPLHNVRDGVRYPPTLIMTADTDDRVDPGMAKKFAARLQAATAGVSGAGPVLIRVETHAGHGAGKPVSKLLDEEADLQAFLSFALAKGDPR